MIDISKQKIQIDCTDCKSKVEVTLQQIADKKTVVCRCGQKIKLQDKNNSSRNSIKNINKAVDDFNKTLKNFGK